MTDIIKDPVEVTESIRDGDVDLLSLDEIIANHKPNPWGSGHLRMYLACALVYLCATTSGFDGSLLSSINATSEFLDYFNLQDAPASTGIVFAIYNIGQMVAAFFLWFHDYKGRRMGMFVGCLGTIVGAIIVCTTTTLGGFIAGRFVLAFFTSLAITAAPLYVVEISPPHLRGTVAGLYNTLFYMGSIMASFSTYGTEIHFKGSNLAWRLPLWIQVLCPGIVCIGVWFIPESPRWLVATDQYEKAKKTLVDFHANGDASHPLVELEMAEIVDSFRDGHLNSWRSFLNFSELYNTRSARYRMMLVCLMSWFAQFCGNNISAYYLPTMLTAAGITSVNMKLLLNAIYSVVGWIFAIAGARCHDLVGRRKMLLGSTLGMSICLAIVAATTATFQNTASTTSSNASIAFIFLFGATYAFGYTAITPIYPSEVMSNQMRAKGFCVYKIVSGAASFVNSYSAPTAMLNIKYWFYVFFVFWDLLEFVAIYYLFVETKGRTLEELEEIFESPNPRKASIEIRASPAVHSKVKVDNGGQA